MIHNRWFYLDSDNPGAGGSGASEGAGGAANADVTAKLAALEKQVTDLMATLETTKKEKEQAMAEMTSPEYLEFLSKKKQPPAGQEPDFNNMSPGDIAKHYQGKLEDIKKEFSGQLDTKTQALLTNIGIALAQMDVRLSEYAIPDFKTNKKDIYEVAKQHPDWTSTECYDEWQKQKVLKAKQDADAAAEKKRKEAAVFAETGGQIPPSAFAGKQPTAEEAAALAYEQTVGQIAKSV